MPEGELEVLDRLRRLYRSAREAAKLAVLPILRPRRVNVCCCGLSKTGTHSLAGIFENYRSAHHPDAEFRFPLATECLQGRLDVERARKLLRRRDRLLWLEMESSALGGILIEPLVQACPDKKFVLTFRDVFSWCDSWIDHNINFPPAKGSPFAALDRVRLKVDVIRPTQYDGPLVERGCASLASYFQLWTAHNSRVLKAVPENRLLVVKTPEITSRLQEIARWVGVPAVSLRADRAWLFAAPQKHRILSMLDPAYVRETAEQHCGALMRRYFPEALPS